MTAEQAENSWGSREVVTPGPGPLPLRLLFDAAELMGPGWVCTSSASLLCMFEDGRGGTFVIHD